MVFLQSHIGIATSDSSEDSTEVCLKLFENFRNVLLLFVLTLVHQTSEFGFGLQQLLIKGTFFVELTSMEIDFSKEKFLLGSVEMSPFTMHMRKTHAQ